MKRIKTIAVVALLSISSKFMAQQTNALTNNLGIDIRADINESGQSNNERIRLFVRNKEVATFGSSYNGVFYNVNRVDTHFSKRALFNDLAEFRGLAEFEHLVEFEGKVNMSNDLKVNTKIGIGGQANAALHVMGLGRDIRVDDGQYQSRRNIELHPDVDNTGDDAISFRNSTNEEMAKLQDGVLTLRKGGKLQSDGELSLLGNVISFRNGFNTEMARLEGGTLTLDQIRLNVTTFPDYVFAKDYNLMPLAKVAAFIKKNKHLPNMPTEVQVVKEGMNIGQINTLLVEKVEELTLYTIAQEQQIKELLNRLTIVEKNMINNNKK